MTSPSLLLIASRSICCLPPLQRVVKKYANISTLRAFLRVWMANYWIYTWCCLDYQYLNLINWYFRNNFLQLKWWCFVILGEAWWKMIGKIHEVLYIIYPWQPEPKWQINHYEKIGHLCNRFEGKKSKKLYKKILYCRVNVTMSVSIIISLISSFKRYETCRTRELPGALGRAPVSLHSLYARNFTVIGVDRGDGDISPSIFNKGGWPM